MEIKFDWKIFKTDKPKVGSTVIFFSNNVYYIAKYLGPDYETPWAKNGIPVYQFVGSYINTKTMKMSSKMSIPIYTPSFL